MILCVNVIMILRFFSDNSDFISYIRFFDLDFQMTLRLFYQIKIKE